MGSIVLDASRGPILVVTFTGNVTSARFDAYLKQMTEAFEDRSPRVVILDALASGRAPAYQRIRKAQWIREGVTVLKQGTIANIFVLASPVTRMVLTSILWIQRLPWPYYVVPNLEQALEKAYTILDECGVPHTPHGSPGQPTE
ncbi:MAG: hypothetical protein ACPG4T_00230 [Nannocystaceae bacterium]